MRTPKTQVARTLRAQCPGRGRCCTHSRPVTRMSRTQPAQDAHSACIGSTHSAQAVGASRDLLPLPSPRPGRDITSRSRPPGRPSQVATSTPCRDLPSAQPKQPRSRPQKNGVATPISIGQAEPCRNIKSMSRHHSVQSQVATPKLGRDPPGGYPMSRHQFYVATSFLPIVGFPGRDTKIQVATSPTATHVATSNVS